MALKLYNTLTKSKEDFKPINPGQARIYTCGPTVYDTVSIGNFRSYIFADTLKRVLRANGYNLQTIENITDVGHLTDDADSGEDKLEAQSQKTGQKATEIADIIMDRYFTDRRKLKLSDPNKWVKATDHIEDQIKMIQELEERGFTYKIEDGIYFDSSKLDDYGKLANLNVEGQLEGARVEKTEGKKSSSDFALWKFSPKDSQRQQEWVSPWGVGFPGWHIECSAMSRRYLEFPFDIHTGGIDHIPVHHTNEIAQNEALTGKPSVKYWLHNEFLVIDNKKMSKSLGNIYSITDLEGKGFSPLVFKYFTYSAHYRQQQNFTWKALEAAQNAYEKILRNISNWVDAENFTETEPDKNYLEKFQDAYNDDMNMPQALAVAWDLINSDLGSSKKVSTLLEMDKILGLNLSSALEKEEAPIFIQNLLSEREIAREKKDWTKADELRGEIEKAGYIIDDTGSGPVVHKKL